MKSLPIVPAQPSRAQYGIGELALFKQYTTREEYEAEFGIPPPAFDPDLRPKYWLDQSVDTSDVEADVPYLVARMVGGEPRIVTTMMPAWEAAAVNIPPTQTSALIPSNPLFAAVGRAPRELPVRALLAGEALFIGFGGLIMVSRADMAAKAEQESGKFLAADRELLAKIAAKLGV